MTPTTNSLSHLESLPDELLLKIIPFLTIKDLKSLSLASYRLFDVTSTEELWESVVIRKYQVRKNGIQPVLKKRFKTLISLDLSGVFCISTADFTALMTFIKVSSIKNVNLSLVKIEKDRFPRQMPCNKALSKVDANLLADAVNALESVDLSGTCLEILQTLAIFEKIISATKLMKLVIGGINLIGVPTDLFVNALSRINQVELFESHMNNNGSYNSFSESQILGLFRKLEEVTVLRSLSVSKYNTSYYFKEFKEALKDVQLCTVDHEVMSLNKDKYMYNAQYDKYILNK